MAAWNHDKLHNTMERARRRDAAAAAHREELRKAIAFKKYGSTPMALR